jgi:hypothetical protein
MQMSETSLLALRAIPRTEHQEVIFTSASPGAALRAGLIRPPDADLLKHFRSGTAPRKRITHIGAIRFTIARSR